ncbi:MAG TPA: formate dehydrogenase [Burkholderiales bacterium]|nr:formate dehydrogenase [Burkholderiales bacterium]
MSDGKERRSRRHFLFSVGAGGAATAAAIVAKHSPTAPQPAPASAKRAAGGYRASEHVHNYYRTTKV